MITEKKQVNSNISLDNIYKAIGNIKPEYQANILANYKLTELYNIFINDEGYEKYINDLFATSNMYINRATALIDLHTEAFIQSIRKQEEFDPATTMCQMFDCMSEEDQKRFCENMLQKKGFFEDAYKMMMDSFQNAVEVQKSDGRGATVDDVTENNTVNG